MNTPTFWRSSPQSYNLLVLIILQSGLHTVEGVWPLPQSFSTSEERYAVSPLAFNFAYGSKSAAQHGCSVLDEAFRRYFPLIFPDYTSGNGAPKSTRGKPFTLEVTVGQNDCENYPNEHSSEEYKLSVSAGQACLNAETVWGALRGLETFSQLVYQDDYSTYFVNKTEIEDFPRFMYRGVLVDTSRHYLPLRTIFKTLDAMSYNKYNVLHWHIVDDPSFPYQSVVFPELSNKGAFHPMTHIYTQADVRKVISHARMRGIRVLPEFDTPGHTASWGNGQPDLLTPCYTKDGEPTDTFGPMNPILNSTYEFMKKLLQEVTSLFPDKYFHLGGDEVNFSCWKTNPNIKAFMDQMGFGKDYPMLEMFYVERIMNITLALNKTPVVWQDVFDKKKQRNSLSVVEVWKGGCYLCKVRKVTKAGLRVILASPWYLDQPVSTQEWGHYYNVPADSFVQVWRHVLYDYQAELSRVTEAGYKVLLASPWFLNQISYGEDWQIYYKVQPLDFDGTEEQKKLVVGGEACMWGEYVDASNIHPRLWPRASAVGERLWSDENQTLSVDLAYPRLNEFRCRMLRRGVQAEPIKVSYCKNEYPDN